MGRLVYYHKAYEGTLERPGKEPRTVRFYDEREWRYVPDDVEQIPHLTRDEIDSDKGHTVAAFIDRLPSLSFEPSDIDYLIVPTEAEILPLFHSLQSIKAKYNQDQIDLLRTKIIAAERIEADF